MSACSSCKCKGIGEWLVTTGSVRTAVLEFVSGSDYVNPAPSLSIIPAPTVQSDFLICSFSFDHCGFLFFLGSSRLRRQAKLFQSAVKMGTLA
jgi:hypothetical protein